ncbi:MAG: twin-arginine translocation signal domain-containing protein, partial [Alphaproteobacteria bacterium]|nr:twin-arginine translocation signal domain-containing protein [Alphaproteobacteria bacterium]
MLIKHRKPWDIPHARVTPEHVFLNRRAFLGAAGIAAAGATGLALMQGSAQAQDADPSAGLYPASANPAFTDAGRPVTSEEYNTTFNNYYEFGTSKRIAAAAESLPIRPWTIAIDGEVEKPMILAIDDLLKQVTLEERVYRHRCVEAWS